MSIKEEFVSLMTYNFKFLDFLVDSLSDILINNDQTFAFILDIFANMGPVLALLDKFHNFLDNSDKDFEMFVVEITLFPFWDCEMAYVFAKPHDIKITYNDKLITHARFLKTINIKNNLSFTRCLDFGENNYIG